MNIISKQDAVTLNAALSLDANGSEQDWDIEFADPDRLHEFIEYYQSPDLSNSMRQALMALIIASFDKALQYSCFSDSDWSELCNLLKCTPRGLHYDVLQYWAQPHGNDDDVFLITPKIRALILDL